MTTTEYMIKALRAYAAEHKHDIVSTDAVDVSEMCFDVADRLEELVKGKRGHWILIYVTPRGDYFKCSECNHDVFLKPGRKISDDYRYCSGCGAKMDGEENDI